MANQLNSGQLTTVPLSTSESPLDLNLSQKISQGFFKFHDETGVSATAPKSFQTTGKAQLKSVSKIASGVSKLLANGFLSSSIQTGSERMGENEGVRSVASGFDPYDPPQSSNASIEDANDLQGDEHTPISAGRKRKISRVEAAAKVQKDVSQSKMGISESGIANEFLPPSLNLKRKSLHMQQTSDATMKVILALEANEDEKLPNQMGQPRGNDCGVRHMVLCTPSSTSKDAPVDLVERRLLLEERKVMLAERRFALEERKLEATIEIGKVLIMSMEKMTNTISGMGVSSPQE